VRIGLLLLLPLCVACVERKLHIRTEPEGAEVFVNGRHVGRSPVTWDFSHYGTVRIVATRDGYGSEQRDTKLKMPWYQYPVLDFFSDLIVPFRIRDEHEVALELQPIPQRSREENEALARETARRAAELRDSMDRAGAEDSAPADGADGE